MPLLRSGDRGACGSMFQRRMGGKVILNRFTPNVVGGKMQLNRYRCNHYGVIQRGNVSEKDKQQMAVIGAGNEGGANSNGGMIRSQAYASGPTLRTVTGVSEAMPNQASAEQLRKRTLAAIDKAFRSGPQGGSGGREKRAKKSDGGDVMEV